MGSSRRTPNYLKRMVPSDPTHMCIADPVGINTETLRIDSMYSLEKDFIELICINP